MRFTLQHILLWQVCCLFLVAANWALSGGLHPLNQGIWVFVVCTSGCVLGLLVHRWQHRDVPIAPVRSLLMGIGAMLTLAMIAGYFVRLETVEVCTSTRCKRVTREWGILNVRFEECPEEAKVIRDELKFAPSEHHRVTEISRNFKSVAYHMPQQQFPILNLSADDLHKLSYLQPVEKCHVLFHLDNAEDIKLAKLRALIFGELRGGYGSDYWAGGEEDKVNYWWIACESLLRPVKSEKDFISIVNHLTGRNSYRPVLDSKFKASIDKEIDERMSVLNTR